MKLIQNSKLCTILHCLIMGVGFGAGHIFGNNTINIGVFSVTQVSLQCLFLMLRPNQSNLTFVTSSLMFMIITALGISSGFTNPFLNNYEGLVFLIILIPTYIIAIKGYK
jgi:hypothetical protein